MVILGVDPGTATTGYGLIAHESGRLRHIASGAIRTPASLAMERRLLSIYERLCSLIDEHRPDVLATEQLFFSSNVTTAMQVGRTVGIALLAAAQRELPWVEYRPAEVKLAVVGYGAAEKKQIQYMVKQLLGLADLPKPDDAADALAIAICHAHSSQVSQMQNWSKERSDRP